MSPVIKIFISSFFLLFSYWLLIFTSNNYEPTPTPSAVALLGLLGPFLLYPPEFGQHPKANSLCPKRSKSKHSKHPGNLWSCKREHRHGRFCSMTYSNVFPIQNSLNVQTQGLHGLHMSTTGRTVGESCALDALKMTWHPGWAHLF